MILSCNPQVQRGEQGDLTAPCGEGCPGESILAEMVSFCLCSQFVLEARHVDVRKSQTASTLGRQAGQSYTQGLLQTALSPNLAQARVHSPRGTFPGRKELCEKSLSVP